jgi:hypothetical protein
MSRLPPVVEIDGYPFQITRQGRTVYLQHVASSLMGMGRSLPEAEIDMRREAGLLVKEMPQFLRECPDLAAVCDAVWVKPSPP